MIYKGKDVQVKSSCCTIIRYHVTRSEIQQLEEELERQERLSFKLL